MSSTLTRILNQKSGEILIPRMRRFIHDEALKAYSGREPKHSLEVRALAFQWQHLHKVHEQYLKQTVRRRDTGKFHPSQLYGCDRATWFNVLNAPRNPPGSPFDELKTWQIFSMGDMVHLRFQTLFHLMSILVKCEVPLEIPELNLEGHCDAIVQIDGVRYVVEIKSCNAGTFMSLREPKPAHRHQVNLYMKALGIKKGIVLYEYKDRHDLKEYVVDLDMAIHAEAVQSVGKITQCVRIGKPPPKEGNSPKDPACTWCNYVGVCHNTVKLEKFLSSLKGKKHVTQNQTAHVVKSLRIGNRIARPAQHSETRPASTIGKFAKGN